MLYKRKMLVLKKNYQICFLLFILFVFSLMFTHVNMCLFNTEFRIHKINKFTMAFWIYICIYLSIYIYRYMYRYIQIYTYIVKPYIKASKPLKQRLIKSVSSCISFLSICVTSLQLYTNSFDVELSLVDKRFPISTVTQCFKATRKRE